MLNETFSVIFKHFLTVACAYILKGFKLSLYKFFLEFSEFFLSHLFFLLQDLTKGTELFTQYEVAMDKEGMKTVLKAALEIGHRYTGKSRKEFATEVRPYLELASKFAEKINVDYLLSF